MNKNPIKVLHVITGLNTGGAETVLWRLLQTLNGRDDIQNIVVCMAALGPLAGRIRDLNILNRSGPGSDPWAVLLRSPAEEKPAKYCVFARGIPLAPQKSRTGGCPLFHDPLVGDWFCDNRLLKQTIEQ